MRTVAVDTVAERVADTLRTAIHRGELLPGERLVERRIAAQLGVSHIPVREALARLDEEGLVERLPHKGARVVELSPADLEEISTLRTVLEQFVCERAQARWTPDAAAELRALVADMYRAADDGDSLQLLALDGAFHETLWRLADHGALLAVVSQLRGRIMGFLQAAQRSLATDALAEHAREHERLVDALESGDPAAIRTAMRRHIEVAADRITQSQSAGAAGVTPAPEA